MAAIMVALGPAHRGADLVKPSVAIQVMSALLLPLVRSFLFLLA